MVNQAEQWLLDEKYNGKKTVGFFADCTRLKAGEPLAYVIGWMPFLNCTIYLDSHPLIPRPETEFWVNYFLTHVDRTPRPTESLTTAPPSEAASLRILDLCAGSGCVGVAVAKAWPHAHLDFAEIDKHYHSTIERNVRENLLPITRDRQQVFGGDLFADIPAGTKYDYILSNPPYIDPALDRTEPSVKEHEPHQALYGGTEGLAIIKSIIVESPHYLNSNGELWLEHEPEQSATIVEVGAAAGFSVTTHTDQYRVERFSQLVLQ